MLAVGAVLFAVFGRLAAAGSIVPGGVFAGGVFVGGVFAAAAGAAAGSGHSGASAGGVNGSKWRTVIFPSAAVSSETARYPAVADARTARTEASVGSSEKPANANGRLEPIVRSVAARALAEDVSKTDESNRSNKAVSEPWSGKRFSVSSVQSRAFPASVAGTRLVV